MQIFWLKRNLRPQDSEPFFESMRAFRKKGKVLLLYCHEPALIQQPDVSRQHQLFIQETLEELDRDIQLIGGKLLQAVGEAVDILDRIHRVQPLTKIWTHQETTQNSQCQRDKTVAAWCAVNGIELAGVFAHINVSGLRYCLGQRDIPGCRSSGNQRAQPDEP